MTNKTAIITGGSRGIGLATALKFAKEGYNTVIIGNTREPIEAAAEIKALGNGVDCLPLKADVSSFSEAESIIKKAKSEFGSIDVLINNAGITRDNLLLRMTEDDFDSVIAVNLKGAFNMIKHASSVMLKQKSGAIINISSVVGLIGNAGQVNYAASKAGIIGITKSAAKELASRGITVNAIAPGFIETDMTENLSEEVKTEYLKNIPLKRLGKVGDIADSAFFLAESSYITGQILTIDGGMVM